MYFCTLPPWCSIADAQTAKYCSSTSRTSSASRVSEKGVKPARSANSTDKRRRSLGSSDAATRLVQAG